MSSDPRWKTSLFSHPEEDRIRVDVELSHFAKLVAISLLFSLSNGKPEIKLPSLPVLSKRVIAKKPVRALEH